MLLADLILILVFEFGLGIHFVSLITGRGNKGVTIGWMAFYIIGAIWFIRGIFDLVNC